jgi:DNA-directed RNA polymerase sigma subunit (sigma70/sigma32)
MNKILWNGIDSAVEAQLKLLIGRLTKKQRQVILHRFGMIDGDHKSAQETADMLGLTARDVQKIQKRALERMRKAAQGECDQCYKYLDKCPYCHTKKWT